MVENEMVFSYLLNEWRGNSPALVCTSGQLRAAARELIDLLAGQGTKIYYSGDMDPDGLLIADKLWIKYPDNICLWRMSVQDYCESLSEERISGQQIRKLAQIEHPQLRLLADEMGRVKKASYQENLKEVMVEDLAGKSSVKLHSEYKSTGDQPQAIASWPKASRRAANSRLYQE